MWGLLLSTIITSAADSLNPIAITQQFVLQGLVKKPRHIWYFILPTGITNLIGGFLAYYGFVTYIKGILDRLSEQYGQIFNFARLVLGIAFLLGFGYLLFNNKVRSLKKQNQSLKDRDSISGTNDEKETKNKIKSVTPTALVVLGVCVTITELMTALPYFAFLAILLNYKLTLLQVVFILIIYNVIYTSPLIVLYIIYIKAQDKFDKLYMLIKIKVTKLSGILVPGVVGIIGVFLVYSSLIPLLVQ